MSFYFSEYNFKTKLRTKMNYSFILAFLLLVTGLNSMAQTVSRSVAKTPSRTVAQSEDELFENMDSDSSLTEPELTVTDPFAEFNEDTESAQPESNSENADLDSFLNSEEETPTADPESLEALEPLESETEVTETETTEDIKASDLEDSKITKDVQALQGENVKTSRSKKIKFIKHPGQKEGLYKISADGRYYYKVEESKQKYGLGIKGGAIILNQLENVGASPNIEFKDIYGSSAKPSFYVEYYWAYFKNKNVPHILKKARVKMGSGLLMATGNGRFANSNYEGVQARESYTFLAFPNHLGLHLSFEVTGKQLIVPFVTGAFEYLVGVELQNENFSRTKLLGQLGAHVGGGLALSLGWLDQMAQFDLDSEFGINQTFFTVELRQNIAIQSDFNFTATFINAGIQLEF